MTRLTFTPDETDHQIAALAAVAILLHMAEAIFPSPLPGVKPGLANIVILFVYVRFGLKAAVWVSCLRVFASSLLLGQFLSPTFLLSLSGAMCSLIMLWFCQTLPKRWFGPISLSILAAFAHIAGQLLLVRLWLIPHNGMAYFVPLFAFSALFFGILNGFVTAKLLAKTSQFQNTENSSFAEDELR